MPINDDALSQAIKSHWAAVSGTPASFEIPEIQIDGQPLTIHHTPLTLAEKGRVIDAKEKGGLEWMAELIILKATDKDGNRLFDVTHRKLLNHQLPSEITEYIALRIMNHNGATLPKEPSSPAPETRTPGSSTSNTPSPSSSAKPSGSCVPA